ncbi:CPBP family intramembrane glutamic endopeptidase [Lyngbya confervoides]|uniref:CPBP family intramembrane metalloprotease n=1 Tax=Lyngbya confervoides BDU141951 TaxID=1574623 RepID=A0ABD4T1M1_9CYAN|nr:CPBP family intramembrane glutamic endopeptidase [Lyngbya confervoides]MCM1982240.1 CPBP family intramembrane metalloprotease [Lyngbya confervoides BDU141951]
MNSESSSATPLQVPFIALVPFLLITFGLAWGILGLFILLPAPMVSIFGQLTGQHPLFYLSVWAPAIAACLIVLSSGGLGGLQAYITRCLLWRCSLAWYAFLLIGMPIIFGGGSALKGTLFTEPLPFDSVPSLLAALLLAAIKGPIEELGWRGLLLPLLQRRFMPIWAGLIVGGIWGIWHLPAFLLSGTQQSHWSFTPFFVGTIALSVIVTPLLNASGGSILLPALFHFQCINPLWPDAEPYDTVLFVAVAGLVIWFNRKSMFRKAGAVTEIFLPTHSLGRNSSNWSD